MPHLRFHGCLFGALQPQAWHRPGAFAVVGCIVPQRPVGPHLDRFRGRSTSSLRLIYTSSAEITAHRSASDQLDPLNGACRPDGKSPLSGRCKQAVRIPHVLGTRRGADAEVQLWCFRQSCRSDNSNLRSNRIVRRGRSHTMAVRTAWTGRFAGVPHPSGRTSHPGRHPGRTSPDAAHVV